MNSKRPSPSCLAYLSLLLPALLVGCFDPVPNPPTPDLQEVDLSGADLTQIDEALPNDCRVQPCPGSRPICDPAGPMCRACQEGNATDEAACLKRDPKTKYCAAGRCAECRPGKAEGDCAMGLGCVAGTCASPTAHGDCDSAVADLSQAVGRCVASAAVVYVNNKNGGCVGDNAGTLAAPVCTITQGLAKLGGMKTTIRVYGSTSSYGPLPALTSTVALYGPGDPSGADKASLGNDPAQDAVTVSGAAADVILDGFEINRGSVGVRCSGAGAKLALRRSAVTASLNVGLDAQGCNVTLDRTFFARNSDGAVNVGSGTYAITNSFFVNNSSLNFAAVRLGDSATGTFRFNTVAFNGSGVPAGIECRQPNAARSIEDSIIFGNVIPDMRDSQLTGKCLLKGTVVGKLDKAAGGVAEDPKFAKDTPMVLADYLLPDNAENRNCCIDKAQGIIGSDFFGTPRPVKKTGMGAGYDVGAYEVK